MFNSVRPYINPVEGRLIEGFGDEEDEDLVMDPEASGSNAPRLNHNQDVNIECDEEELICQPCDPEEEAQSPNKYNKPICPSANEVEEHNLTHWPYRNWCVHCVRGKAKALNHAQKDEDRVSSVPIVSLDYAFMYKRTAKEIAEGTERGMPTLVIKDRQSKTIKSRVVPAKSVDPYAIKVVKDTIDQLGYKKLILKSDGEPAILALKEKVKAEREEDIILENSPAHDSQSNGEIEQAIQSWQGQCRTVKSAFETRCKRKLPNNHPLFPWLVIHASDLITRFSKGVDGKTAYERIKGRKFNRPMVEWGECVQYCRLGSAGTDKAAEDEYRWVKGIFLGHNDVSGEVTIGTELGVVKARDIKRYATNELSWDAEFIFSMKGTPWQPVPGSNRVELVPTIVADDSNEPILQEQEGQAREVIPRSFQIFKADVERLGLTPGCDGCVAANRGTIPRNHSTDCRKRHELDIAAGNNPAANERKLRAEARLIRETAKQGKAIFRRTMPEDYDRYCKVSQNQEGAGSSHTIDQRTDDMDVNDSNASNFERHEQAHDDADKDHAMGCVMLDARPRLEKYFKEINMLVRTEAIKHYDANTGKELNPELVKKARSEEMEYVHKMDVYTKVPIAQCIEETGKNPIAIGWVDVNKGDDENPEVRCRLVGKEYNDQKRNDLFAATPPLESNKVLFSMAVTEGIGFEINRRHLGMKLMFLDISRAYYHSRARRRVYVQLPPEDAEAGMCALLNKSMQGTRDAAQNWEFEYAEFLESIGFKRGKASPCIFYCPDRNIRVAVHGDDFTVLGYIDDLDWFNKEMNTKFEVKCRGIIGPAPGDLKSIKILNRIIEWDNDGIQYEPDQRHAEILIREMGLLPSSKSVITPGVKVKAESSSSTAQGSNPSGDSNATSFRRLTARANYLAQDRSDIQFAVKELCSKMSNPNANDEIALKRLGRYLIPRTRMIHRFDYQSCNPKIIGWSDSDWAGSGSDCSRKSTSGGVLMLGNHVVKTWSSTQSVYALSSGEAEYYAMVKCCSVSIGLRSMLRDLGIDPQLHINTDASAAIGIASRRGLGRIRHIDVDQLWVQDLVARREISIHKVKGTENLADTLTKHVGNSELSYHIEHTHMRIATGRHALMPSMIQ